MLRPIQDRILIRRIEASNFTNSGFYLLNSHNYISYTAEVLAVGTGLDYDPITVKVGDIVVFSPYGGVDIKDDIYGDCILIRQCNIIAILEDY